MGIMRIGQFQRGSGGPRSPEDALTEMFPPHFLPELAIIRCLLKIPSNISFDISQAVFGVEVSWTSWTALASLTLEAEEGGGR
jgi:hypothetical protein